MTKGAVFKEAEERLAEYGLSSKDCSVYLYNAGEVVFQEGMPNENLYIVFSGSAKVCVSASNGKDMIICYYVADGILGDVELMTDRSEATTTVIAETNLVCIVFELEKHRDELKSNMAFLNRVGRELSLKLVRSTYNHVATALRSGEERVCYVILQEERNGVFSKVLTDFAHTVGISYRHLFRILNQLCDEGILEKIPKGYKILDHNELKNRASRSG